MFAQERRFAPLLRKDYQRRTQAIFAVLNAILLPGG
jgi:hypothetical protein